MNHLKEAVKLAELVGHMLSPHVEVVFHDLTKPNFPIVKIINNHITQRHEGDSTSVLFSLEGDASQVVNYDCVVAGKRLKSSSIKLQDENGHEVLAISFNYDPSGLEHLQQYLGSFFNASSSNSDATYVKLSPLQNDIHRALIQLNLGLKSLKKPEIINLLTYLKKKGQLDKRGMISALAKELKLTRKTIYSYIECIRT